MKRKNKVFGLCFLLIFASLVFTSCEKVIDVDLNSSSPAIVIEGSITDQAGPHFVKISKSVNFDESNVFPPVTGALVTFSDDMGGFETLVETSPGTYASTTLAGVPGRTYTLKVVTGGKEYVASSTMYAPVAIDTVLIEIAPFGMDRKYPNVKFQDPSGVDNFYRIVEIVNNDTTNSIYVDSDYLLDGEPLEFPLFDSDVEIDTGDSVKIVLQSIDENTMLYFRALNQLINVGGGGQSTSPANPPSNFGASALGYFSAYSFTTQKVAVP